MKKYNAITFVLIFVTLIIFAFFSLMLPSIQVFTFMYKRLYIYLIPLFIFLIIGITKNKKLKFNYTDLFFLLYIIFCILSCFLNSKTNLTIFGKFNRDEGLITLLFYFLLYFFVEKVVNRNNIKKYIKYIQLFAIIQAFIGIIQSYFNVFAYFDHMAFAFSGNPNMYGLLMATISILSLSLFLFKDNSKLNLITFVLCYIALLLSESSGSFFPYCLMILIILIKYFLKNKKRKNIILIFLSLIFLFPIIQYSNYYVNTKIHHKTLYINSPYITADIELIFSKIFNNNYNISTNLEGKKDSFQESYSPANGRLYLWNKCFYIGKTHLLFGIGLDRVMVYDINKIDIANSKSYDKCHNNYLEIFSSTGIFPLICYLSFILSIIYISYKSKNTIAKCLSYSFILYSIIIGVTISTPLVAIYYYAIIGMIRGLENEV